MKFNHEVDPTFSFSDGGGGRCGSERRVVLINSTNIVPRPTKHNNVERVSNDLYQNLRITRNKAFIKLLRDIFFKNYIRKYQ